MNTKGTRRKLEHWQIISIFLAIYDFLAMGAAYFLALWLRFDGVFSEIPPEFLNPYLSFILPYCCGALVCFYFLRMYNSMWRFSGSADFVRVFGVSFVVSLLHAALITVCFGRMPLSYYVLGAGFQFVFLAIPRFGFRFVQLLRSRTEAADGGKRIMLIGAGSAGQLILRDINQAREIHDTVVCIIDDNPNKWQRYLDGVPIIGGREEIFRAVKEYKVDQIFLAIPSATAQQKRDILAICNETDCEVKQLPGMYQLMNGEVTVSAMKDVSVEDLLGREPVKADLKEVFDQINGKVVMVTGGGGSIGSELCRQIAAHRPKQLIIVDIYENNAYTIQLELKETWPDLNLETLIASVRDSRRMFQLFKKYRPEIVYHAAAHKHVPLMEDSPCEAIKNNAIGTYKTAYAAMVHGCRRFVLISTDKAVNPTNVMGASKRLCEMVIQAFDAKIKAGKAGDIPQLFTHETVFFRERASEAATKSSSGQNDRREHMFTEEVSRRLEANRFDFSKVRTEFVAVRFGNVLGSNGSVIPIFRRQIERGGPVTVTHPDIIRYFMTIPEAVSLVMLAGTYAKGGEIFVLDMGSPVKIDTLARNLIRLSGFKPDVDIRIEYTGLRPGEKLYEEKLMAEEGLQKTENDLIHIGNPIRFDEDAFLENLKGLMKAAYANRADIRDLIMAMVDTYKPAAPTDSQDPANP